MSPNVLAPLSLMFQGLPGPVGDPGPKGSRVSGPWQVPYRQGPGWALPVPAVGLRAIRAGRPSASVCSGTGAKMLPPVCFLESRVAAGGPDDGELMSQAWSPWLGRLGSKESTVGSATVQLLQSGICLPGAPAHPKCWESKPGHFVCHWTPQRRLCCS